MRFLFVQCWTNVEDVGPTLYKCYTKCLFVFAGMYGSERHRMGTIVSSLRCRLISEKGGLIWIIVSSERVPVWSGARLESFLFTRRWTSDHKPLTITHGTLDHWVLCSWGCYLTISCLLWVRVFHLSTPFRNSRTLSVCNTAIAPCYLSTTMLSCKNKQL